jgi:hypothetical protein
MEDAIPSKSNPIQYCVTEVLLPVKNISERL